MRRLYCLLLVALLTAGAAGTAAAKTSHAGWPAINGLLKIDHSDAGVTYTGEPTKHNELLGGHGSDTLHAGRVGDVLWGDHNPGGQPTTQVDQINGGAGKDYIYAGHGRNVIDTGGGADQVHAHFGSGTIRCASTKATIFLSHRSAKHYKLRGCTHVSYKTLGY
ncbi:MAG TPA: hypothetical protein VHZ75_00490 [Solirubrobacteraceae bacterium]|jgi:Ca2+-binding RTX toxin-like protein|nr:hypothetical protein [Solirubrobacteraceae bacterium]